MANQNAGYKFCSGAQEAVISNGAAADQLRMGTLKSCGRPGVPKAIETTRHRQSVRVAHFSASQVAVVYSDAAPILRSEKVESVCGS